MEGAGADKEWRKGLLTGGKGGDSWEEGWGAALQELHRELEEGRENAADDRLRLDCAAGCPACCVLYVAALPVEVFAIAAWLKRQPATMQQELRGRLQRVVARLAWMEQQERIRLGILCAFVDAAGNCAIHPVRPLLCRALTSTDRHRCQAALEPDGGEAGAVVMDLEQRRRCEEAFGWIVELLEGEGYDSHSVEVMRGVLAVLDDGDLVERFRQREVLEVWRG